MCVSDAAANMDVRERRSRDPAWLALLLRFTKHVINGSSDFVIREIHPATFRRHETRRAREALNGVLLEDISTLSNSGRPRSGVTNDRGPTDTCSMTSEAGRVVHLRAG
jgi:hypothetical protein